MKAHYRTANGRLTIELQGETDKTLYANLAHIQEIFEAESECGCCKSKSLRYVCRQVDDFSFYELSCLECNARFQFGQKKVGGDLFPKRKDDAGNPLPNRGWARYTNGGSR